jgi:hypothetical protein
VPAAVVGSISIPQTGSCTVSAIDHLLLFELVLY